MAKDEREGLAPPNSKNFFGIELDVGTDANQDPIAKVLTLIKRQQDNQAFVKLSFDQDPIAANTGYASVYKHRTNLIPPALLKRIRDSEEMIGGVILPIRSKQASLFARPRPSRFDLGFAIYIKPDVLEKLTDEQQEKLKAEQLPKLRDYLLTCGNDKGVIDRQKRSLGQFFTEIVEDILTFGCFAVEIRKNPVGDIHSFRAIDAGTIYFTTPQKGDQKDMQLLRESAAKLLTQLEGHKIDIPRFQNDEYTYVQVVDETPRQAFTDDELLYWMSNPSTDINRSGYPVTPIERIVNAITTHINLTTHNKMYFLNGRAARNILVFKSENLEESDVTSIKAQMVAHINSSNAAWRMPVFGVTPKDDISIVPLEGGGNRDMEFQYLADLNKRMIFAAYQMSPDEVAALSYLSRGTNSQSLSESNNEWKLIAARDTGLRPLLLSIEDFINTRLLPKINKEWSDLFMVSLEGLDADSPEKEATRLQQDSELFLTMNDIMERVEKDPVPLGGDFPLNAAYMQNLEKYFTKGQILKSYGGEEFKDADKDQNLQYYMNDPVWLQLQQINAQQQAMTDGKPQQPGQDTEDLSQGQDLDSAMGQLQESLGKSERITPAAKRQLLAKLNKAKKSALSAYKNDAKQSLDKVLFLLEKTEESCKDDSCEEHKKKK